LLLFVALQLLLLPPLQLQPVLLLLMLLERALSSQLQPLLLLLLLQPSQHWQLQLYRLLLFEHEQRLLQVLQRLLMKS
jgi:hypothetical protein